ncbi:MAG: PilZ domain-containing protein [Candidatus Omnitrophota bacterium]|nr:PilZ domain-containing protein [Candidatus Omnitrophota bacterium]
MVDRERRTYPRVEGQGLSLKLNMGDFDIMTHTLNLSASGMCCKVDKEIPLMSRVKLMFMMPDMGKEDKAAKGLEVDGVVVRQHPVIIDGQTRHYDIAIFFDNLSPKNQEIIEKYVASKKC